jgi:hypothetical protein
MFMKLTSCDWVRERRHCLLTGPSGVGKSWLAGALGYKACRENLSVFYQRVPRLFAVPAGQLDHHCGTSIAPILIRAIVNDSFHKSRRHCAAAKLVSPLIDQARRDVVPAGNGRHAGV